MKPRLLLEGVPFPMVARVWPVVAPLLLSCIKENTGEFTLNDTLVQLEKRNWQLWLGIRSDGLIQATGVTEIINYPSKKVCRIVMLAGEGVEAICEVYEDLSAWALGLDCRGLEVWARPGMAKMLQKHLGFTPKYQVCTLDISRSLQ